MVKFYPGIPIIQQANVEARLRELLHKDAVTELHSAWFLPDRVIRKVLRQPRPRHGGFNTSPEDWRAMFFQSYREDVDLCANILASRCLSRKVLEEVVDLLAEEARRRSSSGITALGKSDRRGVDPRAASEAHLCDAAAAQLKVQLLAAVLKARREKPGLWARVLAWLSTVAVLKIFVAVAVVALGLTGYVTWPWLQQLLGITHP
jgi:hypothetical protein